MNCIHPTIYIHKLFFTGTNNICKTCDSALDTLHRVRTGLQVGKGFKSAFSSQPLKDAGGFIFAKCRSNSRQLDGLSPHYLTSPKLLRDRVGNARTYIIPIVKLQFKCKSLALMASI